MPQTPGPIFEQTFIAARDALTGPTTDHRRVQIAQCAFMNALLTHPRVRKLFEGWVMRYRLQKPTERLARALDALAAALGLDHRSQLFAAAEARPWNAAIEAGTLALPSPKLLNDLERAQRALVKALGRVPERIAVDAAAFVHETLKLDWPWLALELHQAFLADLSARAHGWVVQIHKDAPPIVQESFTVSAEHGESLEEAARRLVSGLVRLVVDSKRAERDPEKPAKRKTDQRRHMGKRTDHVAAWAVWLYRVKVNGEAVSVLADEYHKTNHASEGRDCSTRDDVTIRKGIKEAERLLNLTPYAFTSS